MKKIISVLLFILLLCFSACGSYIRYYGGYVHPRFSTDYTVEEHIQRISQRTEEKYSVGKAGSEYVAYRVGIIHAFYDDDPEYFFVELERKEEKNFYYEWYDLESGGGKQIVKQTTKFKHFIGFIQDDRYYSGLPCYNGQGEEFWVNGREPYAFCGYDTEKKYYGRSVCAVQIGAYIRQIYTTSPSGPVEGLDELFVQRTIPESEYEKLMKSNLKYITQEY